MTKTIEELAKQYAKYQTDEQGYGSMEEWKQDVAIYYDDAKEVLSWLFALPLASRLTAEEKERVRGYYSEAQGWLDEKTSFDNPNEQLKICAVAIQDRLERIFGSDFFKEEE